MAQWIGIEIAELIERGREFLGAATEDRLGVEEKARVFLDVSDGTCRAGVLGLAMIARAGDPRTAVHRWVLAAGAPSAHKLEAAAEILGIPVALARMIELNHRNGVTAAAIARGMRAGTLGIRMTSPMPLRLATVGKAAAA